jgi:hypothetical protein
MEFLSVIIARGNRSLRPFQLAEDVIPRTLQQIEVEVGLVQSLALVSLQGVFEVA